MARRPFRRLIREASNVFEIATASDCIEQFQESLFSLAANRVIDVPCVECCCRVVGGEIATPNDRQVWKPRTNFTTACDRADRLRARHNRYSQEFHSPLLDYRNQTFRGMGIQVAVNDSVVFFTLHNRSDRKNR